MMLKHILRWFRGTPEVEERPVVHRRRRTDVHAAMTEARTVRTRPVTRPAPARQPSRSGDGFGSGRYRANVATRSRFVREDTGTHETLKILDDSVLDAVEEDGIDPYNSGQFDRARNWDRQFRD